MGVEHKLGIFGSCVTRDLFNDASVPYPLVMYVARTSVISTTNPPVALDDDEIGLDSAFQARCVAGDFRKSFFSTLAEASPDWLIIDLLEERFDLLRTDGSLITRSSDFMNSRLPDAPRFDFELIKRYWPETRQLYADGVPGFAERLQETVSAQRVILHHVRWATTYWSGADLRAFPADRVAWGEIQNELLADAYGRLAAALPGCQHISMPDELFVGDATGRWALEPFHYSEAYNAAARSRLVEIVDG